MKTFSISLMLLALACAAIAQDKKYVVSAGMRPRDVFSYSDIYLYPSFKSGKVQFKNDRVGAGVMNYNRYTSEIDFIDNKGDTLALADQETIKFVAIGNDVFYFQIDVGYLKKIKDTKNAMLASKEYFELADRRRHPNSGKSGQPSGGSYNGFITTGAGVSSGLALNMVESVDMIYRKKTEFFIANAKGFFLEATKKNFLRIFSDKKTQLTSYFEQNAVDFENEESLLAVFKMASEITPE